MADDYFPDFAQRYGGFNADVIRGVAADLAQATSRVLDMSQQLADDQPPSAAFIDELEQCQRHIDAFNVLMSELLQRRPSAAE